MSELDQARRDLVIANRILARDDEVDAYGHIRVRHPDNPKRFFISRSLAPELIEKEDIVELDLDGQPGALPGDDHPFHLALATVAPAAVPGVGLAAVP